MLVAVKPEVEESDGGRTDDYESYSGSSSDEENCDDEQLVRKAQTHFVD